MGLWITIIPNWLLNGSSLSWVCTCNPSHQPDPSNPPTKHSPNLQGYTWAWPAMPGLIGMDLGSILGPCLYHDLNFWSDYWTGHAPGHRLLPFSIFFLLPCLWMQVMRVGSSLPARVGPIWKLIRLQILDTHVHCYLPNPTHLPPPLYNRTRRASILSTFRCC